MIVLPVENISLNDFSSGFGSNVGIASYPPNMSPDCINVVSKIIKTLQKRNGYELTSNFTDKAYGLIEWILTTGTKRIIVTAGTNLKYRDDFAGNWTTAYVSLTSNTHYEFTFTEKSSAMFLLMTNWNRDPLLAMDNTASVSVVAAAPIGKHINEWQGYVWIANLSGAPSDMQYSSLNDYETWPSSQREYLSTKFGDEIRGFGNLKKRMYVFKDWSIFRYSYLGGSPLFQNDPLYGIGTKSGKTIKEVDIPGAGKGLMFLGSDGRVYLFDGYNPPEDISDIVWYDNRTKANLARINFAKISNAVAVNYRNLKWYVLFFPVGTNNTVGLIFDYRKKPISVWPIDNHNVADIAELTTGNGYKKPFFTDYLGNMFEFDKGSSDNGSAINAWWYSPRYDIGSVQLLKQGFPVALILQPRGHFTLDFKYRRNYETNWFTQAINQFGSNDSFLGEDFKLGVSKLGASEAIQMLVNIDSEVNQIQFCITDNSTNRGFIVWKLESLIEKVGYGQ